MIKLSIIIPYYQKLNPKLFESLLPQLNDEVEVILVDDGCDNFELDKLPIRVIHLPTNSGGASVPRNVGLDAAEGEFIAFIDADDFVSGDYIREILNKINSEQFDYCFISWWSPAIGNVIINDNPPSWNCCVWDCIYRKSIIGNLRFDPDLIIAEDYDFNVRVRKGRKANISKVLYFYDSNFNPQSLIKTKG